ncbi:bifunctional UDP-N-acetylglucosamine diphosphorylase/glucosamine-1-phosphate N-acetyltransferase GlmU [soil metagenome]
MNKPLFIILAGGEGKNFYPVTVNKTLLPILGKPILQHAIEMVEQSGFPRALIVTNQQNEDWLSTYQPFNITLQTHVQQNVKGMAQALLEVEQEIGDQPILVMNAVDMIDPNFFKLLYRETLDSYAFVTGMKVKSYFPGGYLNVDGKKALDIIEKPEPGKEPSDMVNLVFHYFSEPQRFLSVLKNTSGWGDDAYERGLSQFMKEQDIQVVPYTGYWQKLKYSHNVLDMVDIMLKYHIKNHVARSAYVSKHAVIEGDVYIDEDARIESFAVIKGPAYIGRKVIIGNHALVRQSVIEEGAIVGFGSEVARSYVGPRCSLHQNFIGDSVLESDINPSWGTTTGNLRLDGKAVAVKLLDDGKLQTEKTKLGAIIARGAFFGINCSIMPGVTVGQGANIYPGKVVMKAVAEKEVVK